MPLYFAGYFGLLKWFRKSDEIFAKLLFSLGFLSFLFGGIWLSSRYFAALVLQTSRGSSSHDIFLTTYQNHYQVLVWLLRILILLVSICYVKIILTNNLGLPKWLVFINPVLILLLVFGTLFINPIAGSYIVPMAMNVAHFVFLFFYFIGTIEPVLPMFNIYKLSFSYFK